MPDKTNQEYSSTPHLIEDLRALLLEGKVTKQEDICAVLLKKGHQVNQSKISRLIRKLDAIKSKNELGHVVYRLAHEPAPPTTASQLSNLMIDAVANEAVIIVKTAPGAAQLIARILDYHKEKIQILGTIAGDDTIFVAPTSIKTIKESLMAIKQVLFR